MFLPGPFLFQSWSRNFASLFYSLLSISIPLFALYMSLLHSCHFLSHPFSPRKLSFYLFWFPAFTHLKFASLSLSLLLSHTYTHPYNTLMQTSHTLSPFSTELLNKFAETKRGLDEEWEDNSKSKNIHFQTTFKLEKRKEASHCRLGLGNLRAAVKMLSRPSHHMLQCVGLSSG